MTATHFIGDACPGGHRDPAELVNHLNRELAAVDIAAVAKRLSGPQQTVLAEVPVGNLRRDRSSASGRAYIAGYYQAVTRTARSLVRMDLVDTPSPHAPRPDGQRDPSYTLTDLGRAVLDHLGERAS